MDRNSGLSARPSSGNSRDGAGPVTRHLKPHSPAAMRQSERTWAVERGDGAFDQKRHAIAQFIGGHHIVRRQEDRRACLANFANDLPDEARVHRIEAGRGLVQKQQFGTVQQGPRQREPASHALRELGHEFVAILDAGRRGAAESPATPSDRHEDPRKGAGSPAR